MKVMQFCLSYGKGGLELYLISIMKWQKDNGFFCHAVIPPSSFMAAKLANESLGFSTLKRFNEYIPFRVARKLARIADENKTDILHIHHRADLLTAVVAKLMSRSKFKVVYTRHMSMSKPKKDIYHNFLFKHVDRFIAVTGQVYEQMKNNISDSESRLSMLYLGVPAPPGKDVGACSDFFRDAALKGDSFKIGMFGRIEHFKGQHILVDAVSLLRKKDYDCQAILIGHATDEEYLSSLLQDVSAKGLSEVVRHYGFHPRPYDIMGCFDVVVLATYKETFGLVLAEAMRCGTAVVGTRAGGVLEIIEDGISGFLFDPGDSDALAAILERLILDKELLANVAERGKERADRLFSKEQHFKCLDDIYRELGSVN